MNRYAFLIVAMVPFAAALAQAPSTYCQTSYGVCQLNQAAPLGSACSCSANAQRKDPGRVIPKPASGNLSGLCRTPVGVCQARAAPVDAACVCGTDRGRMVPSR
jgi:hypothetical protein